MKTKLVILFFLLPWTVFGQRAETGTFLVKPYLQYGTQTSMYVLWETSSEASTKVEYGEARLNATDLSLTESVAVPGNRFLHEVQLENLKVQTQYFWRVRSTFADGQELVSPVYTFRTAVKDSSAYMFALLGDTQYNSRTPWAWGKIAELVWQDRPSFVVHAGDLVDIGTKKTDWTQHFFPNGHAVMSRFPMYTVLGNHEQDAQLYYDYMVNPEPEYYYTFHYGNAQFFMIDTNKEVGEGSEQYDWLEWELAKSNAIWKFVVHHHPPYSSEENDHGDTYKGESSYGTHARNLVPLYETYGVDFCLFGHTHVYERTWPIFKDLVNQQEGVIYINSGGAGG
ncbi:MAG: metallophosphoesterase family protein, partial [Bacteroidota bacterium]